MIPAAAVSARVTANPSYPFFTFIPLIFTAIPINRRRLYELRTKMIAFEFRLYASALNSFFSHRSVCLVFPCSPPPTHTYSNTPGCTHTHLHTAHTVYARWSLKTSYCDLDPNQQGLQQHLAEDKVYLHTPREVEILISRCQVTFLLLNKHIHS